MTMLRLQNADGSWIADPDLMVLSALTSPKPEDIEDTYAGMRAAPPRFDQNGVALPWSYPQKLLHDKVLLRHLDQRLTCGSVVWQVAKLHKETGRLPSLGEAIDRQVDSSLQRKTNRNPEYLRDTIRTDFNKWKPIAAFLAFLETHGELLFSADARPNGLDDALGTILGWERYLDVFFTTRQLDWMPIRCPAVVQPIHPFDFLDDFEPNRLTL